MAVVSPSILFFIAVLTSICIFLQRKYSYWKNKNVPHLKPTLLLGNYGEFFRQKKCMGVVAQELCQKFPKEPYVGAYFGTEPALIVQDPELIKLITTKDFYYFNSREIMDHTHKEHVGHTLFFIHGDKWKVLRQNMTPLFSPTKMKNMFYLIEKCAHSFEDLLDRESKDAELQGIRPLMARYTIDCICSCVFGVETSTMSPGSEKNPFRIMGETLFEISNIRGIANITRQVWPGFFYGLGFQNFPKVLSDFFNDLLVRVFEGREYKPSARNDFVDLMLSLKQNKYITGESLNKANGAKKVQLEVDDKLLVAQCMVFFGAGFETSATAMSATLYELAKSPEAQARAIKEVDEYMSRREGKLEYECVNELPYLEACIDEVLRLYPVLGVLTREVVEDYTLPTGLRLERGMRIHLPLHHLHHHPDHFPEPEKFIPERFLPEQKGQIKPYTYMPFGEGPRICIGLRFARMQTLSGLLTVLKKYRVELAEGMPRSVELEPRVIVTQPKEALKLRLVQRDGWEQRVFARGE